MLAGCGGEADAMSDAPTVFVVDDDPAVRDALRWLVEPTGWRVETFARARAFLDAYDPARPGCLVLDVRMPGMSGPELQAELAARGITLPIILLSAHGTVPVAVRALKAGALDFVEKPYDARQLLARIRDAVAVDQQARGQRAARAEVEACLSRLTAREREILQRLLAGEANKEIAAGLRLSPRTVEAYRARILLKLEARSLLEVVRLIGQ
jgi:two-component system response regulator FixJ